jgi:type III restriction enzyme
VSTHAPPLHAALDYCARKLLAELELAPNARAGSILAHRLTPTSAALLHWWCSAERCKTRFDNFHSGQRQAILHTVLAHELLQTDDPEWLYRLACDPMRAWPETTRAETAWADTAVAIVSPTQYAGYVLRMSPGSGLRWVVQALLVWQWANHDAARASGREDPRFSGDFALLSANSAVRLRLEDALFGPVDACAQRDAMRCSVIRHAHLFLPPSLRTPLREWLERQGSGANGDGSLRIVDAVPDLGAVAPRCLRPEARNRR